MWIDTTYRSRETEIMDDFNMEGPMLKETLVKIDQINRRLGGNDVTINGVLQLVRELPADQMVTIMDAGCGSGEMLRQLADTAKKINRRFRLIGVDANATTIGFAKELSVSYPDIEYYCEDIMSEWFEKQQPDIILGTLTLHHFPEEEVKTLLRLFLRQARVGIVINDLQRSALAYRLFSLLCIVFNWNRMVRTDGKISILRGFKKKELEQLAASLQINHYSVKWKWAFRYQWIIKNL